MWFSSVNIPYIHLVGLAKLLYINDLQNFCARQLNFDCKSCRVLFPPGCLRLFRKWSLEGVSKEKQPIHDMFLFMWLFSMWPKELSRPPVPSIGWFECGMFVMLQVKVCLQKGSFCFWRGKLPQIFVTLILVEPLARRNQRSPSHLRTLFFMFTTPGLEEDRGKMICYYCLFSRLYWELFYPVVGIIVSHCTL